MFDFKMAETSEHGCILNWTFIRGEWGLLWVLGSDVSVVRKEYKLDGNCKMRNNEWGLGCGGEVEVLKVRSGVWGLEGGVCVGIDSWEWGDRDEEIELRR